MADTKTQSSTRDRVYLKSGMGSVAAEDYDPGIHGKALDLSDEEYAERQRGIIRGITTPTGTPPAAATPAGVATAAPGTVTTTIAGLRTFDPATQPAAVAPAPPPVPIAAPPVGQPVATLTAEEHAAQQQRDQTLRAQATADQAKVDAERATVAQQHADDAARQAKQQADEAAKK